MKNSLIQLKKEIVAEARTRLEGVHWGFVLAVVCILLQTYQLHRLNSRLEAYAIATYEADAAPVDTAAVNTSLAALPLAEVIPEAVTAPKPRRIFKADPNRLAYIKRFSRVAQTEQDKYGVPASITLAQGILESGAGLSTLAKKSNNHFGIKCFSKKCGPGHCTNFNDDSHKDFFRNFENAWASFRYHSEFLQGKRYRHLSDHGNDFRAWAHGLKKAGYATDPRYAYKLIQLIEDYQLNRFDNE